MKKATLIAVLFAVFSMFNIAQAEVPALTGDDWDMINHDIDSKMPAWAWDLVEGNPEALELVIQILKLEFEILTSEGVIESYLPYLYAVNKNPEFLEMARFVYLKADNFDLVQRDLLITETQEFKKFYKVFEQWMNYGMVTAKERMNAEVSPLFDQLSKIRYSAL